MKGSARSELGKTLQIVLAIPEANTLCAWAGENPAATESNSRLRATLRSLLAGRDVTPIPRMVLEFYLGSALKHLWPEPETPDRHLH
jgi:hypothetical protein